jgi:hypothetical protein
MFDGLSYFAKIATEPIEKKVLVYSGTEAQNRTEFSVVPWRLVK